MIQQRVTKYIEKEHLFSLDAKILIALSGGADSVALLCILHTAGYHCEAAHCNFHLRGEESDRDELHTDEAKCIKCCACVKACVKKARVYDTPFAALLSDCFKKQKLPQTIL